MRNETRRKQSRQRKQLIVPMLKRNKESKKETMRERKREEGKKEKRYMDLVKRKFLMIFKNGDSMD